MTAVRIQNFVLNYKSRIYFSSHQTNTVVRVFLFCERNCFQQLQNICPFKIPLVGIWQLKIFQFLSRRSFPLLLVGLSDWGQRTQSVRNDKSEEKWNWTPGKISSLTTVWKREGKKRKTGKTSFQGRREMRRLIAGFEGNKEKGVKSEEKNTDVGKLLQFIQKSWRFAKRTVWYGQGKPVWVRYNKLFANYSDHLDRSSS